MRLALTSIFVLALLALGVLGPPALDAFHDRQHQVVVQGPLSVYEMSEERSRGQSNSEIARLTEKDTLKVMRIRIEKDYMVVRVQLPEMGGRDTSFPGATSAFTLPRRCDKA